MHLENVKQQDVGLLREGLQVIQYGFVDNLYFNYLNIES